MGHASAQAALIYQHSTVERDRPSTHLKIVAVAAPTPPTPEPSHPGQRVHFGIVWRILLLAFIAALMWLSI
jgi:hypothetical protein